MVRAYPGIGQEQKWDPRSSPLPHQGYDAIHLLLVKNFAWAKFESITCSKHGRKIRAQGPREPASSQGRCHLSGRAGQGRRYELLSSAPSLRVGAQRFYYSPFYSSFYSPFSHLNLPDLDLSRANLISSRQASTAASATWQSRHVSMSVRCVPKLTMASQGKIYDVTGNKAYQPGGSYHSTS